MINTTIIQGRLCHEPEIMSSGQKSILNFSIANNYWNGKENAVVFINCVAWGKQADNIAKFVNKGHILSVEGSLIANKFTKKDGTEVNDLKLNVMKVHFEDNRNKNNDDVKVDQTIRTQTSETTNDYNLNDDDLPF
ncbi:MAG: single-stranded DNA-binding protein [bacterium]